MRQGNINLIVNPQGRPLRGAIDRATRDGVFGWIQDPEAPETAIPLRCFVDGVEVLGVVANVMRPDLVRAGIGPGGHGFECAFAAPLSASGHRVELFLPDGQTQHPASPLIIPAAANALRGHIDSVSRERISGWVVDRDLPSIPVVLAIAIDGVPKGRVLANAYRPDLEAAGIGTGRCAFDMAFTPPLSALRHTVTVARESDGLPLAQSPLVIEDAASFDESVQQSIIAILDGAESDADLRKRLLFLAAQTQRLLTRRSDRASSRGERIAARQMRSRWAGELDPPASPILTPRALIVETTMPRIGRDAASSALVSHARALQRLGYEVVLTTADMRADGAEALESLGIACCHLPWFGSVEEVLRNQAHGFDLVYMHRVACAFRYTALVRANNPRARVVYSVADLHHLRLARQAVSESRPELAELAGRIRGQELWCAAAADAVIVHSAVEAALLREALPKVRVHVVPWAVPARASAPDFASRRGLAFIGGFRHTPNLDAALWLCDDVMPALRGLDPTIECFLVGSDMPDMLRSPRPGVTALGEVSLLETVFDRVRLTVAPLQYGAGIKGKVLESMAAGIPCICTPIAAEGIALGPQLRSLIAADAAGFAASIYRLHGDPALHAQCRREGLNYVAEALSEVRVDELLAAAIA